MAMGYSFFPTARELIKSALEILRVSDIENTNSPTTNQYARAVQTLNFMLTHFQTHGMQLFTRKEASFSLTQGSSVYTIGPGGNVNILQPLRLYDARRKDATSEQEVPLKIYSEKEYLEIPNKLEEGTPIGLYFKPRHEIGVTGHSTSVGQLYLWQPADAYNASNTTIYFNYQRPFVNISTAEVYNGTDYDYIDLPQEWMDTVKWNLALRLAPVYGTPMMEYDRIKSMAKDLLDEVLGWDTEQQPLYIQPRFR